VLLNMGSMNFAFHLMGTKVAKWRFPWEQQYILDSEGAIFRNTFKDIARVLTLLRDHGTRYEHECYDIGHLYNLAYFLDRGSVKPPLFIQSVFGILGGIGATPITSCSCGELPIACLVISMCGRRLRPAVTRCQSSPKRRCWGGHVRVGLEDSLFIEEGCSRTAMPSR